MNIPEWMHDPMLTDIPKDKLLFFEELIQSGNGLSKEKKIPYMIEIVKKAKEKKISFSQEEITLIISVIKRYASESEINTIDKMMAIHKKRNQS